MALSISKLFSFISIISCVLSLEPNATKEKMEANGIVPDVIDVAPSKTIEVTSRNYNVSV